MLGNAQYDTNLTDITAGSLFPVLNSTAVYHCPADQTTVKGSAAVPHLRSYSVGGWLGANFNFGGDWVWPQLYPTAYVYKTRESILTQPGPSDIFAFIDDNEKTIDDGIFVIGEGDRYDCPADRHGQGTNMSFLDGHADHHRWRVSRNASNWTHPTAPDADHDWLVAHLPTK